MLRPRRCRRTLSPTTATIDACCRTRSMVSCPINALAGLADFRGAPRDDLHGSAAGKKVGPLADAGALECEEHGIELRIAAELRVSDPRVADKQGCPTRYLAGDVKR
jgi:hypothetical protein